MRIGAQSVYTMKMAETEKSRAYRSNRYTLREAGLRSNMSCLTDARRFSPTVGSAWRTFFIYQGRSYRSMVTAERWKRKVDLR